MKTIVLILLTSLLFFNCSKIKHDKLIIDRVILTDYDLKPSWVSPMPYDSLDSLFYYKINNDTMKFHPRRILQLSNNQLLYCDTRYTGLKDSSRIGCFTAQLNNEDIIMFNEDLQKLNYKSLDSLYNVRQDSARSNYIKDMEIPHFGQLILYYDKRIQVFKFHTYGFYGSELYDETFSPEIRNFIFKLFQFGENKQKYRIQPNPFYLTRQQIITELCKYALPEDSPPPMRFIKFFPPINSRRK